MNRRKAAGPLTRCPSPAGLPKHLEMGIYAGDAALSHSTFRPWLDDGLFRGPWLRVLFHAAVFFVIFFSTSQDAGAQMAGISTEELANASSLVVLGDVEEVQSVWSDDGRKIVSRATVLVQQVVRGKTLERKLTVEYPGGEIGGLEMKVSDVAPLEKGERVLLFLGDHRSRKAGSVREVVGKAQGKYSIGEDGIARKKGFSIATGGDVVDHALPLDDIIRKIKSLDDKTDKD